MVNYFINSFIINHMHSGTFLDLYFQGGLNVKIKKQPRTWAASLPVGYKKIGKKLSNSSDFSLSTVAMEYTFTW